MAAARATSADTPATPPTTATTASSPLKPHAPPFNIQNPTQKRPPRQSSRLLMHLSRILLNLPSIITASTILFTTLPFASASPKFHTAASLTTSFPPPPTSDSATTTSRPITFDSKALLPGQTPDAGPQTPDTPLSGIPGWQVVAIVYMTLEFVFLVVLAGWVVLKWRARRNG